MLKIETIAPDFTLMDEVETKRILLDYRGGWVVLYFYPKDDTPGCTKEACTIAEVYDEFAKLGVRVIGVSKDSPESHRNFKDKYHLPFTLLSDESGNMISAYGAWQKKSLFGKRYSSVARITYIINPDGKIVKSYSEVTPADHALQLLDDLRVLTVQ